MKNTKRLIIAILAAAMFNLFGGTSAGKVVDRIVAIVNDDVITLYELDERKKTFLAERGMTEEQVPADIRPKVNEEVLNIIILDKLTEQEVKRYHIMVPRKSVDAEIERIKDNNMFSDEELVDYLKEKGMTYEEFRKKISQDLKKNYLIERLLKRKTVIADKQVKEYYEAHRDEFAGEVARHIQLIFLPYLPTREDALKLAANIQHRIMTGDDFGGLARIYSRGPAAEKGGDLGLVKVSELRDEVKRATSAMRPGGVSPTIQTPEGIYILKFVGVKVVGRRSFADVKENIRWLLKNKEMEKRFEVWYEELKAKAFIKKML